MSRKSLYAGGVAGVCLLASWIYADNKNFIPDVTFKGSDLKGWHSLGQADWRAENGEIIGTPRGASGGWLMLDRSYQDVAIATSFRAAPGAKAGILLRAEKSSGGYKGVYVSLAEGDTGSYNLTLDAQGNE